MASSDDEVKWQAVQRFIRTESHSDVARESEAISNLVDQVPLPWLLHAIANASSHDVFKVLGRCLARVAGSVQAFDLFSQPELGQYLENGVQSESEEMRFLALTCLRRICICDDDAATESSAGMQSSSKTTASAI